MISDYEPIPGYVDEMFTADGEPRPHAARLAESLDRLGRLTMMELTRMRERAATQRGITFEITGPDGIAQDRPFPLDLIPRIIPGHEWDQIESGLRQRIRALNMFLEDVYGRQEIIRERVVPWEVVLGCPSFRREVHGVRPPGGVWCTVAGCDLVRDGNGDWRVLEDNVRVPSGVSYVLENRLAMTRLAPELFDGYRVRPVDGYATQLRDALLEVAPVRSSREATIVVWTPGPVNSAYFEHSFLARQMGVELVEASDLLVRDDTCYMRTTSGLTKVDAIYRRLDDDFIDPMEFRPDSLLGVPGLTNAIRAGTVAVANAIGTGVADDKAVYKYVPDMIRFYLGEEPVLRNVDTYLLRFPDELDAALSRMDELVFKPTSESGGKGVFIGPLADEGGIARQRELVLAEPDRWIAQETVNLSTGPTMLRDGSLVPRHLDLRPFAVYGSEINVIPGGLTRVALREGSMIVNSSQGGGSKDTWVLQEAITEEMSVLEPMTSTDLPQMPALGTGAWTSQQQQQQQAALATRGLRGGNS